MTGMTNEFNYPDAHSNYVGFYGSLGVFGCVLAGIHFYVLFALWLEPSL